MLCWCLSLFFCSPGEFERDGMTAKSRKGSFSNLTAFALPKTIQTILC